MPVVPNVHSAKTLRGPCDCDGTYPSLNSCCGYRLGRRREGRSDRDGTNKCNQQHVAPVAICHAIHHLQVTKRRGRLRVLAAGLLLCATSARSCACHRRAHAHWQGTILRGGPPAARWRGGLMKPKDKDGEQRPSSKPLPTTAEWFRRSLRADASRRCRRMEWMEWMERIARWFRVGQDELAKRDFGLACT